MEEDIKYLKSQEAYEMYFRGNPRLEKIVNRFIERIKELEEETDFRYDKKNKKFNAYCSNCQRLYNRECLRIYRERKRSENS